MDNRGHALRGSRVYVRVPRSSAQSDILTAAVHQMQMVNCKFVPKDFVLCLPDGRVASFLPGGEKPFSLAEYKEITMLDFCKLVFYLRETDTGLSDYTLYKMVVLD